VLYRSTGVISNALDLRCLVPLCATVLYAPFTLAIYKKGSKSDRGNYRPVSLTSVCCKILEQLIRDHMMAHLLGNSLISNKQYGFINGRVTSLQLLHMLDKWTEYLEDGGHIYIYSV